MSNYIARQLVHVVADTRKFYYKRIANFADQKKNKRILELGSGPLVNNKYYYSSKHLFDKNNDFVQSDINEEFGHQIIDVTKMKNKDEFDIILCVNVIEHVYAYTVAIKNMHRALKNGGTLIIAVPAFYPLHDEPHDYWRFTEHALRRLLVDFTSISIFHRGKREFPFGYYVEAVK